MDSLGNKKTTILEQIASYNKEDLENYIYTLKRELEQQKQINTLLTSENHDQNIKQIKTFIERNSGEVDYQLENLLEISEQLKHTVSENEKLKNNEEKYDEIVNSQQCNEVAEKLKKIKTVKDNINSFLLKQGIISPQQ
tara:strand:- start:13 stop:429 length:417 start_codon:yes stop_codon:yes gene_type:complete